MYPDPELRTGSSCKEWRYTLPRHLHPCLLRSGRIPEGADPDLPADVTRLPELLRYPPRETGSFPLPSPFCEATHFRHPCIIIPDIKCHGPKTALCLSIYTPIVQTPLS